MSVNLDHYIFIILRGWYVDPPNKMEQIKDRDKIGGSYSRRRSISLSILTTTSSLRGWYVDPPNKMEQIKDRDKIAGSYSRRRSIRVCRS